MAEIGYTRKFSDDLQTIAAYIEEDSHIPAILKAKKKWKDTAGSSILSAT